MPNSHLIRFVYIGMLVAACSDRTATSRCPDFAVLGPASIDGVSLARNSVVLTLDEAPGEETTAVARFLADANISATFFVTARRLRDGHAVVAELRGLGHTIGIQGFDATPWSEVAAIGPWMRATDFEAAAFYTRNFFPVRPPDGQFVADDIATLNQVGLGRLIGPIDWDRRAAPDMDNRQCVTGKTTAADCAKKYTEALAARGRGIIRVMDNTAGLTGFMNELVSQVVAAGFTFEPLARVPDLTARMTRAGVSNFADAAVAADCREY